jgi:hypothetical protein
MPHALANRKQFPMRLAHTATFNGCLIHSLSENYTPHCRECDVGATFEHCLEK